MFSAISSEFSTTRTVTRQQPVLKKQAEDKFETVMFLPEGGSRQGEGGLRTQGYFKTNVEDKPLITVITVVFNGEKLLEETIQSVISQTYENVEYIIIDGGSTDGTLDIIKRNEDKIDYWISEKDKGIYDAMNKGIDVASGEIIGLINADDWYEKDTINTVIKNYSGDKNFDIFHGNLNYINKSEKIYKPNFSHRKMLLQGMSLYHPTCFVKRSIYEEEKFDTNYQLVADYKLIFSMMLKGKKFCYIDKVLANMRAGGAGTVFWKRIVEGHYIRRDLGFNIVVVYFTSLIRIILTLVSSLKRLLK